MSLLSVQTPVNIHEDESDSAHGNRYGFQEKLAILDKMFGEKKLMDKWFINFLALLIWYGNGQRNQV